MKNNIFYLLKSKIVLKIKGNNIERFIRRLKNNNIEILSIKYVKYNEIKIKVYKEDVDKIIKIKTIYEIDTLDTLGLIKIKNNILNNKYILIFILIFLIIIYILSNIIFSIDIVTNDSKMKEELKTELEELGIKKYNFKLNYIELQKTKNSILNNHKKDIEWIEIESIGTKYIIRYEPRIITNKEEKLTKRNIVAKKDSVITKMNVSKGQIVKSINTYVKKGDIIVSGNIMLDDNTIKDQVSSEGIIYGETWYNLNITYPYKYYEKKETGKEKNILVINFLNNKIELFNFKKYKNKIKSEKVLLENNILPISLTKEKQREVKIIKENNNEKEVIKKAINKSKEKINKKLKEGEYIKDYKILNKTSNKDSITLNIFFTVVENIGEYSEIIE